MSDGLAGAERFDLAQIAPLPWKNGAGSTREIAVHPRGAGIDGFEWRVSIAEVDRAAPFSAYPGIDRVIALFDGHGLRLRGDVAHDLVEPFVPFGFAGECAIDGVPVDGPTRDLNVMTRRGTWSGAVEAHRGAGTLRAADAGALLCVRGRWALPPLAAGEGLVWRAGRPALEIAPASGEAVLIDVRLTR